LAPQKCPIQFQFTTKEGWPRFRKPQVVDSNPTFSSIFYGFLPSGAHPSRYQLLPGSVARLKSRRHCEDFQCALTAYSTFGIAVHRVIVGRSPRAPAIEWRPNCLSRHSGPTLLKVRRLLPLLLSRWGRFGANIANIPRVFTGPKPVSVMISPRGSLSSISEML